MEEIKVKKHEAMYTLGCMVKGCNVGTHKRLVTQLGKITKVIPVCGWCQDAHNISVTPDGELVFRPKHVKGAPASVDHGENIDYAQLSFFGG